MSTNGYRDDRHEAPKPSVDAAMAMLGALLGQILDRLVAAHPPGMSERLERLEGEIARLMAQARGEPGDMAERTTTEPGEVLVFGTGERVAVTDRVFRGEAGALLLKWKREADAAVREAERRQAECEANVERLEAARLLDENAEAWRAQTKGRGLQ